MLNLGPQKRSWADETLIWIQLKKVIQLNSSFILSLWQRCCCCSVLDSQQQSSVSALKSTTHFFIWCLWHLLRIIKTRNTTTARIAETTSTQMTRPLVLPPSLLWPADENERWDVRKVRSEQRNPSILHMWNVDRRVWNIRTYLRKKPDRPPLKSLFCVSSSSVIP